MGDALTIEDINRLKRAMVEQGSFVGPLRYFAMPHEMADSGWVDRFKRNYPNVELVEVRRIPVR